MLLAAPGWAMRTVSVTGIGRVSVRPDVAHVSYAILNETRLGPKVTTQEIMKLSQALVQQNQQRVLPAYEAIKGLVGSQGTVEVDTRRGRVTEYEEDGRNQVKKYRVLTTIQVRLEGFKGKELDQKLSQLYDASNIQVDEVSDPSYDLRPGTRARAQKRAYRLAVKNGIDAAQAQLERGEDLGEAVQRGNRVEVPSPMRFQAAALSRQSANGDESSPLIESGKIAVQAAVDFLFEVLGTPARLMRVAGGQG